MRKIALPILPFDIEEHILLRGDIQREGYNRIVALMGIPAELQGKPSD